MYSLQPFTFFGLIFLGAAKMKKCSTCKIEKSLDDFYNRKDRKDGKVSQCKICCGKTETKRKEKDTEKHRANIKKYNAERKEKVKEWYLKKSKCPEWIEKQRQKRIKNKERISEYHKKYNLKNKEKRKQIHKIWYQKNKKTINEKNLIRRKNNQNHNLACKLRSSLLCKLKYFKARKIESAIKLLGCTIDFFREYIESKFKPGMSWDNHGLYGWHLDHIIPCKFFDLTKEEEQKKCFHYSNFQPLWAGENLSKGAKILGGNFDVINPN